MPFSPLMTKESKLQIERRIVEVLGELCGRYHQISKIEDLEKEWLYTLGIDVSRSELHDASGINDDYPIGRGVFIEDTKEFVVLVNFEDHLQVIMLPERGVTNGLKRSLLRMFKLLSTFEKMGFATNAYLGNLSVNPEHLGTCM